MSFYRHHLYFTAFLIAITTGLVYTATTLSISAKEAKIFFDQSGLLSYIINFFADHFGQNDLVIKAPFIGFYFLSSVLIYLIGDDYFDQPLDRFLAAVVFMILPGVLSASLLVNESIIVIFCILLYIYVYKVTNRQNYLLLLIFLFVDNSFAIFYLALFFYSLKKKDNFLIGISLALFAVSMYMYGFDTGGKPKGYLPDIMGIYASIFSPLLFLYFFYVMYRTAVKGTKSLFCKGSCEITWYIAFVAFVFSFLLSFRQRIEIEDFAPYVVVAIPLMLRTYLHSLRVRLPRFRKKHIYTSYVIILFLVFTSFALLVNKPLYLVVNDYKKHFAHKHHFAKEIADKLKEQKISGISSDNAKLLKRLSFYEIEQGSKNFITLHKPKKYDKKIDIKYLDKTLVEVFVTNLNTK